MGAGGHGHQANTQTPPAKTCSKHGAPLRAGTMPAPRAAPGEASRRAAGWGLAPCCTLPKTRLCAAQGQRGPGGPSPEVLAQREREKAERQRAEQARQRAAQAAAAADAVAQWDAASDTGASPYLARKVVQAYGLRFAPDGCVLVPLRDAAGDPVEPAALVPRVADGTDKLFLKGGRKSGLWHWCGDPAGASVL